VVIKESIQEKGKIRNDFDKKMAEIIKTLNSYVKDELRDSRTDTQSGFKYSEIIKGFFKLHRRKTLGMKSEDRLKHARELLRSRRLDLQTYLEQRKLYDQSMMKDLDKLIERGIKELRSIDEKLETEKDPDIRWSLNKRREDVHRGAKMKSKIGKTLKVN
jgi:hypothetical protein